MRKNDESMAELKRKITKLQEEKNQIETDRNTYRDYVVKNFKDNLALVGSTKYYSPETIVKEITSVLAKGLTFKIWW